MQDRPIAKPLEMLLILSHAHLQKKTDRGFASTKRLAKRLKPKLVQINNGLANECCNLCISSNGGTIVLGGHKFSIMIDCKTGDGRRISHGESCKRRSSVCFMHYLLPSHHVIFPSDQSPMILDLKMEPVAKLGPPFRGRFNTSKSSSFFNLSRNIYKLGSKVWYVDKLKHLHCFDLDNLASKIDLLRNELSTADCPNGSNELPILQGIQLHSDVEEFCIDRFSPVKSIFVLSTSGTVKKLQSKDGTLCSPVFVLPKEHQRQQQAFTAITSTRKCIITASIAKTGKQFRVQYLSFSKRLTLQDKLSMAIDSENPIIRILPVRRHRVTFCLSFHSEVLLQILYFLGPRLALLTSLKAMGVSNKLLRGAIVDKKCSTIWVPTSQRMFQLKLLSE
jgi:hypothetical protein